jgi:hypothetical protein
MADNHDRRSEEAARVDEDLELDEDRAGEVTGGKLKTGYPTKSGPSKA